MSGTIDRKTYLKNFRGGLSPFSPSLDPPMKVGLLPQGQVLEKVLSLQKQIVNFFEDRNISCKLSEQIFAEMLLFGAM